MVRQLTIQEAAEATGVSPTALRYYERAGLLEPPARDEQGHRIFTTSDLDWIRFLLLLRASGMPIRRMRRFVALERAGDETLPERVRLREAQEREVRSQLADLEGHLEHLRGKVEWYRRAARAAAAEEKTL